MSNRNFQDIFLEELSYATSYNRWIVGKFEDFLGQKVLEVGGGIGSISKVFVSLGKTVWVSEVNKKFLKILKHNFENILYLDIEKEKLGFFQKFDSVVVINVLEHIENRIQALKNCRKLIKANGSVIILVPAHNFLYGSYDKNVGHFLRYTKNVLKEELSESGLKAVSMEYCNKLGAFGWFVNSRLLKKGTAPKQQVKLMNAATPFLGIFDKLIPGDFGMSLICIAKKDT